MSEPGPDDAKELREYLAVHDALCPQCRYNLRGLAQERCPECGKVLSLAEVADPDNVRLPMAWWACYVPLVILGVIGVVAGFGFLGATMNVGVKLFRRERVDWFEFLAPILLAPPILFLAMEHRWARDGHLTARWPVDRLWRRATAHWTILLTTTTAIVATILIAQI